MAEYIYIVTKKYKFKVELNDTNTSKKLLKILPVKSRVARWGDEIYFSIPMEASLEDGVEVLDVGMVAFWPPGSAFCIFFGKTPASVGDKPQAASRVTVLGKIVDLKSGDISSLRDIKEGEEIKVTRLKI